MRDLRPDFVSEADPDRRRPRVGGNPHAGRPCRACGAPTRHGKPWCSEHVLEHPFAADVARRHDALTDACERARDGGPISPELLEEVRTVTLGLWETVRERAGARRAACAGDVCRRLIPRPHEDVIARAWDLLGFTYETRRGITHVLVAVRQPDAAQPAARLPGLPRAG